MFLKPLQTLVISCTLALSSIAAYANGHAYDKMVVFGDSLSDNGNLYKWSGLPEKPYFDGRFTNGKLWVEMVAKSLHIDTSLKAQFADYAFGGAWAADASHGVGGLVSLSYERNNLYFVDVPPHSTDISNNLFVIWIGNNDYLQTGRMNEDANAVTDNTIKAIKTHLDALIDSGAQHFLILNLPDLGQTPKARQAIKMGHPEFAERISQLSKIHNEKLAHLIKEEQSAHANVEFISFDLAAHLDDLIQHPEKYNIKDVTNPCYQNGLGGYEAPSKRALPMPTKKFNIGNKLVDLKSYPDLMASYSKTLNSEQQQYDYCANTNDFLFWDYVHPTALAHELISVFVTDMLVNGKA